MVDIYNAHCTAHFCLADFVTHWQRKQEYLLKIATTRARKAIQQHLRNAQREGITVSYDTLLNLAVDAETDEDYVPSFFAAPALANYDKFESHFL